MPDVRAAARRDANILALTGNRIEDYGFEPDGALAWQRTLRLRRAGHDMAIAGDDLLVADGNGLSIYRGSDGAFLSSVDTCGKVRRVFVDGSVAIVVGLRSILVVDVSEPAAPVVLERARLALGRDHLDMMSSGGCGWLDRGIDRLCDALGACGVFGRMAAAYADHRLFLNLLGMLYVLDFRGGGLPEVVGSVPVGFLTDMAAEGQFLYGNLPGHRTVVVAEAPEGTWTAAGTHDVPTWVEGVVDARLWAVRWGRGLLQVARRQ